MVRKMRVCSPCFSLGWKPTMFQSVPKALSWRSCTTARGDGRCGGRAGRPASSPEAQALRPGRGDDLDRLAALEVGRVVLPLLELGLLAGQQCRHEASYCGLSIGQLK